MPRDSIEPATTIESLGFDSLSMAEVAYTMEMKLGIKAENRGVFSVPKTVEDVVDMIALKLND